MAGELSFPIRRVLAGSDDPEALAALLRSDLPYPLGEALRAVAIGDESFSASTIRVLFTVIEGGHARLTMAPLGAFLVTILTALIREEGSSDEAKALLAQAHQRAAAERETAGDVEEMLTGWAMGAMLQERGAARVYRPTMTGA